VLKKQRCEEVEKKVGEVIRCCLVILSTRAWMGFLKSGSREEGWRGYMLKSCVDYCDDYFLHYL